jgi:Mannosyl-glycoprotein endo-beta-N-acetylglucosaminidase
MAASLTAAQQQFVAQYSSYAQAAASQTGVPWQTILAQWADETAYGTSAAFTQGYNFAGVSPGGSVASYPSLAAGLAAYVQTLSSPLYASVRNAASGGPVAAAQALGASPWAASHYDASGGGPGSDLVAILDETGLDGSTSATNATLASSWYSNLLPAIAGGLVPGSQLYLPGGPLSGVGSAVGSAASSLAGSIAGDVVTTLVGAVEKPAIGALVLILAGGLIAAGVWKAAQPKVQPALDNLKQQAGQAASVAAVAA